MNVSAYATRLAALVGMAFFLAGPAPAAIHTVTVGPGLTFSPASITITEGDTIEWSFAGGFHSVRSGSGCISDGTFDSGAVSVAGTTYSFTYNTAGTYDYHCGVGTHCAFGMEGSVTVEAAPPPSPGVPSMDLWALGATALLIAAATLGSLGVRSRRARDRAQPNRTR